MNKLFYITVCFLALFSSCATKNNEQVAESGVSRQEMEELNRYMVEKDKERISSYIERKGLEMVEYPLGFWLGVEIDGNGEYIKDFDRVVFEYDCSLLDGTLCYSSKELGNKEIIMGKSEMEPGLDAGLRMLNSGSEAYIILPPFLAYGLKGDGKNIPSRSVIVYRIKILTIN